jgi:PPOX class probable F420-dependent enzyme
MGMRDHGGVANQRAAISMDAQEVRAFITQAHTVVLCTTGPDGVPDPVPMWFVVRDDVLWMRTYAKSQKVQNLLRDPRAALLIESGERYVELHGVQLTGPIALDHDVDRICTVFADLMVKYEGLDPQFIDDTIAAYRPTAAKQVALACPWTTPPWHVVSWDHRKQGEA